jgi:hypothetical protein
MRRALALAVLAFTAASVPAAAQTPARAAGSLTDVTGVWTMLVAGHQIGLELEQKGTKVEGVMLAMGRRVLVVGDSVERTLTLKGERPEDGAGFSHGGEQGKDAPGPIVASMKDDGTLEGELSTNQGRTQWTGERLKTP